MYVTLSSVPTSHTPPQKEDSFEGVLSLHHSPTRSVVSFCDAEDLREKKTVWRMYRCRERDLKVYIPSHMLKETTPDDCCGPISDMPRHLHLTEVAPQCTVWLQLSIHYTWFLQLLSSTSDLKERESLPLANTRLQSLNGNVVGAH